MTVPGAIPTFTLFGETNHFPDIVHCESFSARAQVHGWRISAHRHAHMVQILLINDGHVSVRVDDMRASVDSGQFLFVPAQMVHDFVFQPDTEGHVISLPLNVQSSIGPSAGEIQAALARPFVGQIGPDLVQLSDLLIRTLKSNSTFRTAHALGLGHAMLAAVAQSAQDQASAVPNQIDARLARLNQLMSQHMADGWGASDYAAALSLTTGHLSRLCRKATGLGVSAYIEHAMIQEACRMLAFTQMPVSEIGYRLGFDDPSYFSKRFRAARAQTPSEYRTQFVS